MLCFFEDAPIAHGTPHFSLFVDMCSKWGTSAFLCPLKPNNTRQATVSAAHKLAHPPTCVKTTEAVLQDKHGISDSGSCQLVAAKEAI